MNKDSKSTPVQIRVRYEDLATISKFVLSSTSRPETAGKILSAGVTTFAEILISNKLAPAFELDQAIEYLEKLGIFQSLRVNKKAFVSQIGSIKVNQIERVEKLLPAFGFEYAEYVIEERNCNREPLEYIEWIKLTKKTQACVPEGYEFGESEYSIPADTDSLLSALEQGKPPTVEGE